jgi:uncharacterized protein (TIGR00369 family)
MTQLSPLQQWQAFVTGTARPSVMIQELIPMTFLEVEAGFIRVSTQADSRHLLPSQVAHGGFCATVIDTVTAGAVHTSLEMNQFASTTDLNVKMVKGIPEGVPLFAEGRLVSRSRQLGTAEGRIVDEEGTLYAWGSATCMIRQRR